MDPNHFASSVLLAIIALLSPLFSYQLFPEWQSWRLPSHRSQFPLVADHRSNEEAPTHIDNNNFPRKFSRLSRDSSDSEGYFQYLNIPSQKVNFPQTCILNICFQGIRVWMAPRRPVTLYFKIWTRKGSQIQNKGKLFIFCYIVYLSL